MTKLYILTIISTIFIGCTSTNDSYTPESISEEVTLEKDIKFDSPYMLAHYIDVGQGDATLLEFPCGAILIDAGGSENGGSKRLVPYLKNFFKRRKDLKNTLNAIIITHNHVDHNNQLEEVMTKFKVKQYIEGGINNSGKGKSASLWAQKNRKSIFYPITNKMVKASPEKALTNKKIDSVHCESCDPEIKILHGSITMAEDKDLNNHSLVIRIDFGKSSFIFTGDLEFHSIAKLLKQNKAALDTDVYQVGHHGSDNATTKALLDAITPDYSIISMSSVDFREGAHNAFAYGHPRLKVIKLLNDENKKAKSRSIPAATGQRSFVNYKISSHIYATGWDGDVILKAHKNGFIRKLK